MVAIYILYLKYVCQIHKNVINDVKWRIITARLHKIQKICKHFPFKNNNYSFSTKRYSLALSINTIDILSILLKIRVPNYKKSEVLFIRVNRVLVQWSCQ